MQLSESVTAQVAAKIDLWKRKQSQPVASLSRDSLLESVSTSVLYPASDDYNGRELLDTTMTTAEAEENNEFNSTSSSTKLLLDGWLGANFSYAYLCSSSSQQQQQQNGRPRLVHLDGAQKVASLASPDSGTAKRLIRLSG